MCCIVTSCSMHSEAIAQGWTINESPNRASCYASLTSFAGVTSEGKLAKIFAFVLAAPRDQNKKALSKIYGKQSTFAYDISFQLDNKSTIKSAFVNSDQSQFILIPFSNTAFLSSFEHQKIFESTFAASHVVNFFGRDERKIAYRAILDFTGWSDMISSFIQKCSAAK